MKTLFETVNQACRASDTIFKERSLYSVFGALTSEIGELATEIVIANGDSYKNEGADGVVGESVDVIVAALDLIYKANPDITEEEIAALARVKCEKWISNISKWQSEGG